MHIVINGANRGIGLEFSRQIAARGEKVTALCRESSSELQSLDVTVIEGFDVTDPPDVEGLEKVDWLILNAGIWRDETLEHMDFESIRLQLEVNTLGPLRSYQKLSSYLDAGSKIGIMTSLMGSMTENSSGGRYGYRMSKAALNSAAVSMAHDLKSREIAVALLHPGYVATDMTSYKGTTQPEDSVAGLIQVMDQLNLGTSGTWWDFRGREIPW